MIRKRAVTLEFAAEMRAAGAPIAFAQMQQVIYIARLGVVRWRSVKGRD